MQPRLWHFREILKGTWDTKRYLLQHFNEAYALLAKETTEEEVTHLCGKRYAHDRVHEGRYTRWGSHPGPSGSGKRRRLRVPHARDVEAGKKRPLETYRTIHWSTTKDQDQVAESILLGISQRDYHRTVRALVDSFGLSASSVRRTFQERSTQALKDFEERDLFEDTYGALLIGGKHLQGRQIVLCLGITDKREKHILGLVETTTENAKPSPVCCTM